MRRMRRLTPASQALAISLALPIGAHAGHQAAAGAAEFASARPPVEAPGCVQCPGGAQQYGEQER